MMYESVNVEPWMARRNCTQDDSELFFIDAPRGSTKPPKFVRNAEAKRICSGCEVATQCLAFALENNEQWGVWGGLDENERAALKVIGAA